MSIWEGGRTTEGHLVLVVGVLYEKTVVVVEVAWVVASIAYAVHAQPDALNNRKSLDVMSVS